MEYRQPIFSVVLIIMLIACPPSAKCNGQGDGDMEHSSSSSTRVVYEHRDVVSQGEQHYRLFESHHRAQDGTSVQNNAKINIETSVHHSNEDKVLVHQQQQQKGQRQKLNKHGNEIIINPRCVSLCTGAVIAINRL